MIQHKDSIQPNEFILPKSFEDIKKPDDLDTFFTLFRSFLSSNSPLQSKGAIVAWIGYPMKWPKDKDLFSYIRNDLVKQLQTKESYFILDASFEGFSPFAKEIKTQKHNIFEDYFPIFDILYYNCEKYNIDPSQIIYVSSNLRDEENIKKYCAEKNKSPIHVISILNFENFIDHKHIPNSINLALEKTRKLFRGKYFASLNKRMREARVMAQFLIAHSEVKPYALMSQKVLSEREEQDFLSYFIDFPQYSLKQYKSWKKNELPYVIDQSEFWVYWHRNPHDHISNRTLFHLVNETQVEGEDNTIMYYTEKTFRPISCFQPLLIYGMPGINRYLKNVGYRTYEDWFDLSFDDEEDHHKRFLMILDVLKDTCRYLNGLSREQQIEWKFKNRELLEHNYNVMRGHEYSKEKIRNLIRKLENEIE